MNCRAHRGGCLRGDPCFSSPQPRHLLLHVRWPPVLLDQRHCRDFDPDGDGLVNLPSPPPYNPTALGQAGAQTTWAVLMRTSGNHCLPRHGANTSKGSRAAVGVTSRHGRGSGGWASPPIGSKAAGAGFKDAWTLDGDMAPDPFCGCATTLVAADRLGRQWTGIALSSLAIKPVNDRIAEERGLWGGPTALLDVPPQRADLEHLLNYRTHRRLYGEQEGICAGLIPMCSGCNRSKGGKTMAEWLAVLSLRWSMG